MYYLFLNSIAFKWVHSYMYFIVFSYTSMNITPLNAPHSYMHIEKKKTEFKSTNNNMMFTLHILQNLRKASVW